MAEGIYINTELFEQQLAEYLGAPAAVAVDNASNALFLALTYDDVKGRVVEIPSHTYPSVPCEIIHAGGKVKFYDSLPVLTGAYQLRGTRVVDSALSFTHNLYQRWSGMFVCISFTGSYKTFKLSKGGMILTDNPRAYLWFKRARFSGRRELSYMEDTFDMLGWNMYMMPELAVRGLLAIPGLYNFDGSPKEFPDVSVPYPDLSKYPIYIQEDLYNIKKDEKK